MTRKKRIIISVIFLCSIFVLWQVGLLEKAFSFVTEERQPPSKQMRTLKLSIYQHSAVLTSPTSTSTNFSFFVGEKDPVIKSAYIEFRGITQISANQNITLDINQTDSFPTQRQQNFIVDSSGKVNNFSILYSGSAIQNLTDYFATIINTAGAYSFYLKTDVSGADVSVSLAEMTITYQFTPPSAGVYPVSGELTSAVFDTGSEGAAYNSIMWKGSLGSGGQGKVRFKLATSNGADGPWIFYGSDGINCSQDYWYEPITPFINTPVELNCASQYHNNHRYFKYKVQICSNDCSSAGDSTPSVEDVVVSWSP